jgi:hypothetical protein
MTESPRLEREYRRLVALYPRAFRRESEEEIVGVLLASARPGQRRVGVAGVLAAAVLLVVHVGAMGVIFYPSKDPLPYRRHRQLDPAQR